MANTNPRISKINLKDMIRNFSDSDLKNQTMLPYISSRYSKEDTILSGSKSIIKTIVYPENKNGKIINHNIDFGTPRTQEAAERLGFTYADCLLMY